MSNTSITLASNFMKTFPSIFLVKEIHALFSLEARQVLLSIDLACAPLPLGFISSVYYLS